MTTSQLRHDGGDGPATAVLDVPAGSAYCLEVNLAMRAEVVPGGRSGVVTAYDDDENHAAVFVDVQQGELGWHAVQEGRPVGRGRLAPLRPDFDPAAFHQLVLHRAGDAVAVTLDGVSMGSLPTRTAAEARVGVWTGGTAVTFEGVTPTALP